MTDENAILAKAILELAREAAHTWDYDGDTCIAAGVSLDCSIEEKLREMADRIADD